MTSTEKELLDCLKDYIKQTETAHVQEGIWFNKVYKDARNLVKKLTIPVVVGQSEQLKPMVFELANKLAKAGHGNEAVSMHRIHNRL